MSTSQAGRIHVMYVGNATRQIMDFQYSPTPGTQRSLRRQPIPPGQQIELSGKLTSEEIDYIVSQHAPYGMIRVDEIDGTRAFTGTCYAVDMVIPAQKLQRIMLVNQDVLVEQGRLARQNAAIAASEALEQDLRVQGLPERLNAFEATIQEEEQVPGSTDSQIAEGIRVTKNEDPVPAPRQRSRRAA